MHTIAKGGSVIILPLCTSSQTATHQSGKLGTGRTRERKSSWRAKSCQNGWRNEAMYCGYTRRESRFNSWCDKHNSARKVASKAPCSFTNNWQNLDGMLYTVKLVWRCPAKRNRPDVTRAVASMQLGFLKKLFATRSFLLMNVDSIYGRPEVKEELYEEREHIVRWLVKEETTLPSPLQFHLHLCWYITLCTSGAQIKPGFKHSYKSVQKTYLKMKRQTPAEHIELRILPPYSPFLNIVENAINAIKNWYKGRYFTTHGSTADEWQAKSNARKYSVDRI